MTNIFDKINDSGYDFYFLVVDKFLDISIPQLINFYSIYDPNLSTKNSGFLLSQKSTQKFIIDTSTKSGHKIAIVPFKPSAKIDHICKQNNWTVISNPSSLNRLLEDKIKLFEICQKEQLPVVPSLINTFTLPNFISAQKTLGDTVVIQTHFGWAGNSSFISNSFDELKSKIPENTLVKFSKYLKGYSLINNCCLTSNGLLQSPPGLQYTGIKPLTSNPLATVGRQWPCFAPELIQNQVKKITSDFSIVLQKYNYQGFFGLDFIVSNNTVYLLECNPRLTASFAFYTSIELKNNLIPLFLHHLSEFINLSLDVNSEANQELVGSEITLKALSGTTIKKYNDFIPFASSPDPIRIPQDILAKVL